MDEKQTGEAGEVDAEHPPEPHDKQFKYLFLCCQIGAEKACKDQIESCWPAFRFSFSRPGFLTYKIPEKTPRVFDLKNAFARTHGFGIDRFEGDDVDELVDRVWGIIGEDRPDRVHVWQRDTRKVGESFEPFTSELTTSVVKSLGDRRPETCKPISINHEARTDERVLDCVLVEPNVWWIGQHWVGTTIHAWPGGVPPLKPKFDAVSRAYYKAQEALLWSRLPIRPGDQCVEIGSAPGGAAQAYLEYGLKVIGVDPAAMNETILSHENFRHIRKRSRDVRRREFAEVRWLFSDSNVTPQQTLDAIEDIVKHESVRVQGMLITLKMPEWESAKELTDYMKRIRSWGFQHVKPRHLAFNRQEVCVSALKHRSMKRF